jgi:hypothetical protein
VVELEFIQIIIVVTMVMAVVLTCLLSHYKLSTGSFISWHSQGRRREDGLSSEKCLCPSKTQCRAVEFQGRRSTMPAFAQRDLFHRFQPINEMRLPSRCQTGRSPRLTWDPVPATCGTLSSCRS